jgi:hypothetical protein
MELYFDLIFYHLLMHFHFDLYIFLFYTIQIYDLFYWINHDLLNSILGQRKFLLTQFSQMQFILLVSANL